MENVKPMPRVLIAGANSGCGKTSITCGILKALVNRELIFNPINVGRITLTLCCTVILQEETVGIWTHFFLQERT